MVRCGYVKRSPNDRESEHCSKNPRVAKAEPSRRLHRVRLGVLILLAGLSLGGCVRTAWGESAIDLALGQDGGTDAGIAADAATDASIDAKADASTGDAGCNGMDRDGDEVCDEVDNCPDLNNPSQLDTDADGQGDACDPLCGAEPIPEEHRLAFASVGGVSINGGGNFVELDAGATFDVEISYVLDKCLVWQDMTIGQNLQVGYETANDAWCAASRGVCDGSEAIGKAKHTFVAPSSPGVSYMKVRLTGALPCFEQQHGPWYMSFRSEARIAAICVH